MSDSPRSKVEAWIVAHLTAQIPGLLCVPSDADAQLAPPYVVVVADKDTFDGGDATTIGEVDVIYATSMFDRTAAKRSSDFKKVLLACRGLLTGDFPELGLIVSGADVMGTQDIEDPETRAKGQVVTLSVGATDMDIDLDAEIFAEQGGYRTLLGNGVLRQFTVTHNLASSQIAAFLLRDAGGSRVYVHGRDYLLFFLDANTLRIELLEARVAHGQAIGAETPAQDGLFLSLFPAL